MQVVIDIDEEYYSYLRRVVFTDNILYRPVAIIAKGKPLPKGHGRLIDADDIDNHIIGHVDTRSCLTIIEADGGDGE